MSKERIINLGFGNFVVASRVVGIINPVSYTHLTLPTIA